LKAQQGDLMLFIIREAAHKMGVYQLIIDWLEHHHFAFTPIMLHRLTEVEKKRAARLIRGGEWGKGCYPKSGGKPDTFIIFYDYSPVLPNASEMHNNPLLSNSKYNSKHALRDMINRNQLFINRCNVIHSSDNQLEALEYLKGTLAERLFAQISKTHNAHQARCLGKYPAIKRKSTYGSRAKVELIQYGNKRAIKKTFKLGLEKYLKRELFAYTTLAKKTNAIPRLLESGDGYLIIEELISNGKPLDIRKTRKQIFEFLRILFNEGYFFTDLHKGNIIMVASNEIKVIDFEFLQQYREQPLHFNESYDLVGVPNGQGYDLPKGYPYGVSSFQKKMLSMLDQN